ncbi:MAG: hypothetical protein DUD33_02250 [Coriobacteriaceae bacterium]|jgi:hypothetical protein|nr:zinc-ribbon domain-containing protein [Olsenella sp.]RRF90779.1 MAG: hypothetical protein DUD33_02250 [Coriobacteriaceae bacterium]
MDNFKGKLEEFMRGRNGADELGVACLELAVILAIINIFAGNGVIYVITLALLAYAIFRMVSTNVNQRRRESMAFAEKLGPVRPWISNPAAAYKNARTYKHATCPNCHQRVRVPRGKGHIRITCPRCKQKFDLHS